MRRSDELAHLTSEDASTCGIDERNAPFLIELADAVAGVLEDDLAPPSGHAQGIAHLANLARWDRAGAR